MTIINAVKKERKGKGLLYLIAIAVFISIVFIACSKKRPTGMADFVDIPEQSDPNETLTPDSTTANNFTLGNTSEYLEGYYFESASYNKNGGGTFKFKVQVLKITDNYGVARILRFTGFDASGNSISRDYNITNPTNPNGQYGTDKRYHAVTLLYGTGNATAIFSQDGKLEFRPSDFNETITLAVKEKTTTDKTGQS